MDGSSHSPDYIVLSDCHSMHSGPAFQISDFASNSIIGNLQFTGAQTVMSSSSRLPISGPVKSVHTYLNMYVFLNRAV